MQKNIAFKSYGVDLETLSQRFRAGLVFMVFNRHTHHL